MTSSACLPVLGLVARFQAEYTTKCLNVYNYKAKRQPQFRYSWYLSHFDVWNYSLNFLPHVAVHAQTWDYRYSAAWPYLYIYRLPKWWSLAQGVPCTNRKWLYNKRISSFSVLSEERLVKYFLYCRSSFHWYYKIYKMIEISTTKIFRNEFLKLWNIFLMTVHNLK